MFRIKQKVTILKSKKIDGRYNEGIVVGIEVLQNEYYLGYKSKQEFYKRFDGRSVKYKVAYIDCFNEKAYVEEFFQSDLKLGKMS